MDIKVICVNNLTYAMTGGQTAPTTPGQVRCRPRAWRKNWAARAGIRQGYEYGSQLISKVGDESEDLVASLESDG